MTDQTPELAQLVERLRRDARDMDVLEGCPSRASDDNRAAADVVEQHQRLLDAIGDPEMLDRAAKACRNAGAGPWFDWVPQHLRNLHQRIADAVWVPRDVLGAASSPPAGEPERPWQPTRSEALRWIKWADENGQPCLRDDMAGVADDLGHTGELSPNEVTDG